MDRSPRTRFLEVLLGRALLLVILVALVLPAAARAHASLVRTDPADGTVLSAAPKSVRFFFDDDVRLVSGVKAVRNGGGSVLRSQPHIAGGRVLVVPLRSGLEDGDYTVLWRVISDDGHKLAGVISFGVGAGRAPPTAALTVDSGPSVQDVVSRWVFFVGLLTAVGAAFFRLAVGPVPSRLLLVAFLLTFIGVSGAVHDVSLSTRFGGVMAAAAVIAGCGAFFAAVAPLNRYLDLLASIAALLLLPVPSLAGHALDSGRPGYAVVVDVLHVAAASLWLGGLVALALALRAGRVGPDTLRRFSTLALASVLVLAVTGVVRAYTELGSLSQVWSTGYGRVLIVKSVLLTLLAAIGWLNRYRILPRLSLPALRRNVAVELALFAVLVGAVALLTDLRPGRDRIAAAAVRVQVGPPPLPAPRMLVQGRQDGKLAVALAYRAPGAEVTVIGPNGFGVNGLAVRIAGAQARPCGPGCYGAFFAPTSKVTVSVDGRRLVFQLPRAVRPAATLVARATEAFRVLDSVSYLERLASSPRNRVVARFTLESPNRLEYRIRGGAAGIVIGPRRWDREPGRGWVPSPWQPTSQPEPIWAGGITNAYLLRSTPTTYVVSFLKPVGRAWFTVALDRRTLLPRQLSMTAPAHFMTHVYSGFNGPARIRPPAP
jgi:copper transport protein